MTTFKYKVNDRVKERNSNRIHGGYINSNGKQRLIKTRKGDRLDEYLIGEDELKYTKELKIKKKKYYIIDFNKPSKKPLKKVVSSSNAKRLSTSEIEKIIQFGINNNDL